MDIFDKCNNLFIQYPFILGLLSGIKQIDNIISTKLSFRLILVLLKSKSLNVSLVTQIFHYINQLTLKPSLLDDELKYMIITSFNIGISNYYHSIVSLFTYELLTYLDINSDNMLVCFLLQILLLFFYNQEEDKEEGSGKEMKENNRNINENCVVYIVIYIPKLFPFFAVSDNNIRSISSKYHIYIPFIYSLLFLIDY